MTFRPILLTVLLSRRIVGAEKKKNNYFPCIVLCVFGTGRAVPNIIRGPCEIIEAEAEEKKTENRAVNDKYYTAALVIISNDNLRERNLINKKKKENR